MYNNQLGLTEMGRTEAYPLSALRPRDPMMTSVGLSPSIYTTVRITKGNLLGWVDDVRLESPYISDSYSE